MQEVGDDQEESQAKKNAEKDENLPQFREAVKLSTENLQNAE